MTAQDLKNSILQLAVQGKLVLQNPSDEPASELLKQITQQKAQLVEEGVIKKEKPLPTISDEDIPFDIPENWLWIRLGDYCLDTFSGKSPVYSKTPTPYEVIGQAANQQLGLDYTQVKYTVSEFWNSMDPKFFLLENDVLLNTLGHGTLGRSGIVPVLHKKLLTDGHLFVFRLCSAIASKYFYYYLQYKRPEIEISANGSTNQTFLSLKRTNQWLIPVPPLAEQERIVAKIEELLPLVSEYDEVENRISALNAEFPDKLRKSILQQAVQGKLTERDPSDEPASELLKHIQMEKSKLIAEGRIKKEKQLPPITEDDCPYDLSDTWVWVRLGDIVQYQGGYAYKSDTYVKQSNNQVVRLGNVKNSALLLSASPVYIPNHIAEETDEYRIVKDTILFTMTGTKGKRDYFYTCKTTEDNSSGCKLYLNQRVGCLRPYSGINLDWLIIVLQSEVVLSQIFATATGNANQANIGSTNTMKLMIPLPPLAEQKRIVARVEEVLAMCDALK